MLPTLMSQVRWNCQMASAGRAGTLSLCGLLLRLRQLFKWEHGLAPWQEPEPAAVLSWVERQEQTWEDLQEQSWRSLTWGTFSYDPFDVGDLNDHLLPQGLAYGAGLSRGMTPTFFLGGVSEVRQQGDLTILILGPELARDLDGTPALCQGQLIYARKEALAYHLWDHLADPMQQNNRFLKIALAAHHISLEDLLRHPQTWAQQLQQLIDSEVEAAIHHELGEAREPGLRLALPAILESFPQTRLEHWVRGLKDALAEVNEWGRIAALIKGRNLPSLAFMLAWRPGLYPLLLPEVEPAFWQLLNTGDWEAMEQARHLALIRLRQTAAGLTELLSEMDGASPQLIRQQIELHYLAPLGL